MNRIQCSRTRRLVKWLEPVAKAGSNQTFPIRDLYRTRRLRSCVCLPCFHQTYIYILSLRVSISELRTANFCTRCSKLLTVMCGPDHCPVPSSGDLIAIIHPISSPHLPGVDERRKTILPSCRLHLSNHNHATTMSAISCNATSLSPDIGRLEVRIQSVYAPVSILSDRLQ